MVRDTLHPTEKRERVLRASRRSFLSFERSLASADFSRQQKRVTRSAFVEKQRGQRKLTALSALIAHLPLGDAPRIGACEFFGPGALDRLILSVRVAT